MTLPDERTRAVLYARDFLLALATGEIKRVPKEVRERAGRILRHYPTSVCIDMAARKAPNVFAEVSREQEP